MAESSEKPDVTTILDKLTREDAKEASEIFMEKEPFLDFHIYLNSLLDKIENETEAVTFSDDDRDDMLKLLEYTRKLKQKNDKKDS